MTTATVAGTGVRTAAVSWVWTTNMRLGGGLLVVAGATVLMGIITAEALYPGTFSTGANEISDLGGTRPPSSVILQPSATIFDVSMALIGLLVTAGAWFVHRAFGRRSVTIPLATLGLGALGVGLFPGNTGNPHASTTRRVGGVARHAVRESSFAIATAPSPDPATWPDDAVFDGADRGSRWIGAETWRRPVRGACRCAATRALDHGRTPRRMWW